MDDRQTGRNIYLKMLALIRQKKSCVLATVVETKGSTPQKPGSSAVFNINGLVLGTVGGGVVEHITQKKAIQATVSKESGLYFFDLENDISDEEAAICGGGMSILLDANPEKHISVFDEMEQDIASEVPGILISVVVISAEKKIVIKRQWVTAFTIEKNTPDLKGESVEMVAKMLQNPTQGSFQKITTDTGASGKKVVLLETIVPLPKLLIAGAGHVGRALSHLGKLIDFEVIVWDERKELANKNNLPDADRIINDKMNKMPEGLIPDRNTFVVIVTPGHKNDGEVLKSFIGSNAGYIGMIGSKKKIAQVKQKFLEKGWATKEQWNSVYTPIGLEINSKSVQEIAVSIAAQLIQVRFELNKNG